MSQLHHLLETFFFHRRDHVAVLVEGRQYSHPQPIRVRDDDHLHALVEAHIRGNDAPPVQIEYQTTRGSCVVAAGRHRVGSYPTDPSDNTVKWLCLDIDAHGKPNDVENPDHAVRAILEAFRATKVPAYLERSGGGHGWHVWIFFEHPLPAFDARRLAWHVIPKNIRLMNGQYANAERNEGVEVFPKQNKVAQEGYGNLVWLPFWYRAPSRANCFYDPDTLEPCTLHSFDALPRETVQTILSEIPEEPTKPSSFATPRTYTFDGAREKVSEWSAWRASALASLPLQEIYGALLTGRVNGNGWLQCRDPESPTGDRHPSAQVADGSDDFERGTFHSFRSGRTVSVFDFMVENGQAQDFSDALQVVSRISSVDMPARPAFEGKFEMDVAIAPRETLPGQESAPTLADFQNWEWSDCRQWHRDEPPAQDWLFENVCPRGIPSAVVAEGGVGKTFFILALAHSMAIGKPIFPTFVPTRRHRVMLLLAEDAEHIIWRRCHHIAKQANLSEEDSELCGANLRFMCGHAEALMVAPSNVPVATDRYKWLAKEIEDWLPDVLIIDPKAQWDGTEENNNAHATQFVNVIRDLVRLTDGTVIITHHERKAPEDDRNRQALSSASARGATGFRDACRWVGSLRVLTPRDAKRRHIPEEERQEYVEFDITKNNYAKKLSHPIYFRRGLDGVLTEHPFPELAKLEEDLAMKVVAVLQDKMRQTTARTSAANIVRGLRVGSEYRKALGSAISGIKPREIEKAIEWGLENMQLVVREGGCGNNKRAYRYLDVPDETDFGGNHFPVEEEEVVPF